MIQIVEVKNGTKFVSNELSGMYYSAISLTLPNTKLAICFLKNSTNHGTTVIYRITYYNMVTNMSSNILLIHDLAQ